MVFILIINSIQKDFLAYSGNISSRFLLFIFLTVNINPGVVSKQFDCGSYGFWLIP